MKKIIFALILFANTLSHAQLNEKFERGSIQHTRDGKIEGFIRADDLSKLSQGLCFKSSFSDRKCKEFGTDQIRAFSYDNGYSFQLIDLKINNQQQSIKLFARLILKGDVVAIYKAIYEAELIYILSKTGQYYALQNDKIVSGEVKKRTYNYRGVLNLVTEGLVFDESKSIEYKEDKFIELITRYNTLKNGQAEDVRIKEKPEGYVLLNVGAGFKEDNSEYYGQLMYRIFQPRISRSTSLNVGLTYFYNEYTERNRDFTQTLISVPLQIQQNLANKNIRPYIFGGISLNYLNIKDENDNTLNDEGLQSSYGVNLLYGGGIEIDVISNFYVKAEYRNESYSHPILFGIGYIFRKKK